MSTEDTVIDTSELQTEESVIMSMDNIELEGGLDEELVNMGSDAEAKLDVDAILNADLSEQPELDNDADASLEEDPVVIDTIPEAIEELLQPFEGISAGEDPRYSDEFVLAKTEIDKLAFNDYNAVMTLAREILTSNGKDLRVAGYFTLANTYINGAKGLIEGLILYRELMERFGDSLYPEKENARNSALLWLNNSKMLAYVKQNQDPVSEEIVHDLERQIERLNEVIVSITNDESHSFNSLNDWIKKKKVEVSAPPPAPVQDISTDNNSDVTARADITNTVSGGTNLNDVSTGPQTDIVRGEASPIAGADMSSVMSETELYSFIRKIVDQLMSDKEYARGIAYARAARWGGMMMPPNEGGKTRLTAPRSAGVNQITASLSSGDNEAALKMCEAIFFEMGGHLLFDLQMHAQRAAKAMGKNDIANLISYEAVAMMQRFPGIEELRYDDDTPFANAETIGWLNKIGGGSQSSGPLISADDGNEDLLEKINEACEVANDADLNAGLAMLNEYRPKTEKNRFQLRLGMSQLCLDHGRSELAYPMLEELFKQAERTSLAIWDVQLAMSVAKQLQNALRSVISGATEQNRAQYEQQLNEVTAQMCRWDLAQAAQFL
ncbi:hypothetical protein MNBD_GAMMA21-2135 [hydrothermal vent metagenome]|uniref:ImpA N-terminal domain-containing protein n=1 Tax=hydrothermal vent metagenome TaxID=652676 RepID=A0A3B1A4F9_9ZZZZ